MSNDLPLPEMTPLTQPWWDALQAGRLTFAQCACGHRWLPASTECPNCLQAGRWHWADASGVGRLVSWVVYHTAYHPAFKDRVPYNVAIVALDEGPQLISSIIGSSEGLKIDQPLQLAIEQERGLAVPRFKPA